MKEVYAIKKTMTNTKGVKTHVLMNDGYSQVLELNSYSEAEKFVGVLNENSDSGWDYGVVTIKG